MCYTFGYSRRTAYVAVVLVCFVFNVMRVPAVTGNSQLDELVCQRRDLESRVRQVRSMFRHAYDSYMDHAYPADELMPISCTGRVRGVTQSRGDIDDALGNFSLTLIDTLDTLFVLNDLDEFERAVQRVVRDVRFDTDVVVSVFEANIRVLGGLVSAHIAVKKVQENLAAEASSGRNNSHDSGTYYNVTSSKPNSPDHGKKTATQRPLKPPVRRFDWYSDQLLHLAVDLGDRLLVAFNASESGLPLSRVNLRHGVTISNDPQSISTCTACAGTFLLEFGALSRLTKDTRYERAARRALDFIWQQRNSITDLVGTVLNVHNGEWIRKESSVGAGIDSYYEYLLKAYVLFDDREMLRRFDAHYSAVMKFLYRNAFLHDALMNRPDSPNRHFVDALLAFWPSVQVMNGDVERAIELHESLAHVHRKHGFLPEAFTTAENDFSAFWEHHLLRPELAESTYFLFAATRDPYYTQIGAQIADNLERHARTPCGYAALSSVHTKQRSDQMDSYVLAETFKYLHLLFVDSLAAFDAKFPHVQTIERERLQLAKAAYRAQTSSYNRDANHSDTLINSTIHQFGGYEVLDPSDLIPIDINEYVFTTEAHILPLSLARIQLESYAESDIGADVHDQTSSANDVCANTFGRNAGNKSDSEGLLTVATIRNSVRELVRNRATSTGSNSKTCSAQAQSTGPQRQSAKRRIEVKEIIWNNPEHMRLLSEFGLDVYTLEDGRVHIAFAAEKARSSDDAAEGLRLLNEVLEITKANGGQLPIMQQEEPAPVDYRYVHIVAYPYYGSLVLKAGPAQFGPHPRNIEDPATGALGGVRGPLRRAVPFNACSTLDNSVDFVGAIALVRRGGCMFVEKVLAAQQAGAVGVLIFDDTAGSDVDSSPGFTMSGDAKLDPLVTIPAAFIFRKQADFLLHLDVGYNATFGEQVVVRIGAEPVHLEVPEYTLPLMNETSVDAPDDESPVAAVDENETEQQETQTSTQSTTDDIPAQPDTDAPVPDAASQSADGGAQGTSNNMLSWSVHIVPARVWDIHGPHSVPLAADAFAYADLLLPTYAAAAGLANAVEKSLYLKVTDVFMRTNRELLRGRPFVFFATLAQTLSNMTLDRFAMLNDASHYELFMLTMIKHTLNALLRGGKSLSDDEAAAKRFAALDEQKRDLEETDQEACETLWLWTKNLTDGTCRILRMRTSKGENTGASADFSHVFVDTRELKDIQPVLNTLGDRIIRAFDAALFRRAVANANNLGASKDLRVVDLDGEDEAQDEDEAELNRAGVSSSMVNSFVNSLFSHLVRDALGERLANMLLNSGSTEPSKVPAAIDKANQRQQDRNGKSLPSAQHIIQIVSTQSATDSNGHDSSLPAVSESSSDNISQKPVADAQPEASDVNSGGPEPETTQN